MYTPDSSLPISNWKQVKAKCRDSFGKLIDKLPSDVDYKVCVVTSASAANNSAVIDDSNCDTILLNNGNFYLFFISLFNFYCFL